MEPEAKRQYPRAVNLTLVNRLKLIEVMFRRNVPAKQISVDLEWSLDKVKKDIKTIMSQARDVDDVRKYLDDVTERTMETLRSLSEQEAIIWKQLDWANAWVIQRDTFGNALKVVGEDGRATGEFSYGPRNPSIVRSCISQLQSLTDQRTKVLGLLTKNTDISIKLQQTEQTQVIILEGIRDAEPTLFAKIRRQILAMKTVTEENRPALPPATDRRLEEIIEGQFEERR